MAPPRSGRFFWRCSLGRACGESRRNTISTRRATISSSRYGPSVRAIVASLLWVGTLSIFAGQLIAGAAVLDVVAHVPRWAGTIISASVVTIVFVSGGALSTVWTNVIQLAVLLIGFIVALPLVLNHAGGIAGIFDSASVPSTYGNILHSSGPGSGWFLLVLAPAFIVSPGLMQKAYGASSERAVTRGIGLQASWSSASSRSYRRSLEWRRESRTRALPTQTSCCRRCSSNSSPSRSVR